MVQCATSSPAAVASTVATYTVTDVVAGPAIRVIASAYPLDLVANGLSQASVTVIALDANGVLASSYAGSITAAVAGAGGVNPATGTFSSGQWSTTYTAGSTTGPVGITFTTAGLPGTGAQLHLWPDELGARRSEALAAIQDLGALTVELPGLSSGTPVFPPYAVAEAVSFVQAATDTAALNRLTLVVRALRRIYHFDPSLCAIDCAYGANPGALGLTDDALQSVQGVAALGLSVSTTVGKVLSGASGSLNLIPFLRTGLQKFQKFVLREMNKTIGAALNAIPDLPSSVRIALDDTLQKISSNVQANIESGGLTPGDLATSSAIRYPIEAGFLGNFYAAQQTQRYLDQAVTFAGVPILTTASQASIATVSAVSNATVDANSFDAASRAARAAGDFSSAVADITGILNLLGSEALTGGALLAVQFAATWTSVALYAGGITAGVKGELFMPMRVSEAVMGGFQNTGPAAPLGAHALYASGHGGMMRDLPAGNLLRSLVSTQADAGVSYEALARQMIDAITLSDSALTLQLLPGLGAATDSLDEATYLAEGPVSAASGSATFTVAGYDSSVAALSAARLSAGSARIGFLLSVGQYLGSGNDPITRQGAVDAGTQALTTTVTERSATQSLVAQLFTTPAVPLVRAVSVSYPDSTVSGQPFSVQVVWTNLGAGSSTGGFAKLRSDSAFALAQSDSVPLADLAPGGTARVTWTLVPLERPASDSLATRLQYFQLSSGCSNGLGDWRTMPVYVQRSVVAGVGGKASLDRVPRLAITPNPTGQSATLSFYVPIAAEVRIEVFTPLGQLVAVPYNSYAQAGAHLTIWAGDRSGGGRLSSGVYFVRMRAGSAVVTRKLVWLH
jgi:hypothetical protein